MASAALSYVGFRCAFGPVAAGSYGSGATATGVSKVRVLAPNAALLFPSESARMVFVNYTGGRRRLCGIDFGLPDPEVVWYADSADAFAPVLSPDGAWIAYATRDDGVYSGSVVFIRSFSDTVSPPVKLPAESAFAPRWWVDPAGNDTFIVFTNSAVINTDPTWAHTSTWLQKISGGCAAGEARPLESAGSYRDGRSKNGEWLVCGYDRLLIKNLSTDEFRVLFTGPQNGKADGDTSQVCNVSITPAMQQPASVMFLDFGCRTQSTVVGHPYGIHEYIFTADVNNHVTGQYCAPAGFTWSHPEWSDNPDFAACALQSPDGLHKTAGVLNLQSGRYVDLVAGDDILFPYLQVGSTVDYPGAKLSFDSIGCYNAPPLDLTQATLSWKLNLFWKNFSSTAVYLIGSSRVFDGIAPLDFSRYTALNMGAAGVGLYTANKLIDDFILNHGKQTKLIALEVMIDCMDLCETDGTYLFGLFSSTGYTYDRNHGFWADSLPPRFVNYVTRANGIVRQSPDSMLGFQPSISGEGWGGKNPSIRNAIKWKPDTLTCRENLKRITAIGRELADRNIHLVLVIMPQSPSFRTQNVYGKYGASLETATAIIDSLHAIEKANTFVHLYDAHNFGLHDYTNADAKDSDHLNETGAHKFTDRLDSLVNDILLVED